MFKTGDRVICIDAESLPEGNEVRLGEVYTIEDTGGGLYLWRVQINGHWLLATRFRKHD